LLVLGHRDTAIAADPDRDLVSIVDLDTRARRATVRLADGDEPGRVVEGGASLVHVALRSGGAIATIDPATGMIVRRVPVCAAPRGLAYDAGAALLHVACADGRLVSLDAEGVVTRTVTLERDLRDVVVLADGRLVVSTFRSATAFVVTKAGAIAQRWRPSARPRRGPTGLQTMSPAVAWRMAPAPDGAVVMLHQRGVDDPVVAGPGGYSSGAPCGSIVESAVTVVAPGRTAASTPGLGLATLAVDVAVSPDGERVAVASPGNAPTKTPQVTIMPLAQATADGPECTMPSTVMAGTGGDELVAVSFTRDGSVVAQSREPAALVFQDGGRVSLSTDSVADTGHRLFHANAGGGIACASCHPEGGDDGRVWSFSCAGPRRTQVIRGGLKGTEPFHWEGDMPDFSSLVHAVFEGRMSGPTLTTPQSSALLGWLDGLPALPNPTPRTAAVARGDSLFHSVDVGCATCHNGARFTNNATVDVGVGGMKTQVPSLRGVVWRAPFLHTGCAKTLRDRFDPACGGGDKHGRTSQLTPAQLDDLVAYLETL
jgi:hypothetical protein